jgi:hypothetical protein
MDDLNGSAKDDEQNTEHGKSSCHGSATRAFGHPHHLLKYNLGLKWSRLAGRCMEATADSGTPQAVECLTGKLQQGIALRPEKNCFGLTLVE